VKARHTFPAGQTSASRLKALLACLEAQKGSSAAEAWLTKARLARSDLEDETRHLPLAALHAALGAFLEVLPNGLDLATPYLASRDNLGVWARVLRGARAPEEAFVRIEGAESEHGRTTRWERTDSGPGFWIGRVRIAHDPRLEKDGLLARARQLELSVIPTLFGYPPGAVVLKEQTDDAQIFEVRWSLPNAARSVALGALAGVLAGAAAFAVHPSAAATALALVTPMLGGGVGLLWSRDRVRRIQSAAQAIRVSALERSLALRETEDRAFTGDLEGAVVAGQYRIGERMGSGASGVIYQATRITDGLPVAIKLLRAATAHDVTASDRLRRESEALGLSWHPNVVEVIDHGHLPDGTSYLVMELLKGETLGTRLKYRVRLSPAEILPIAKQVTEALVAIHAAGVVHRDLKPTNIYLVPDVPDDEEGGSGAGGGVRELVKVFDFGIARVEWEEMRITNVGAPLGTPGYMSPEQESGGEVDARCDVYAVGAVLYECFVGEPPPPSALDMWKPGTRVPSSFGMRLPSAATSGVQPASRRMPSAAPVAIDSPQVQPVDAPPEWRLVVERALARRPEDRFQDARALLGAIRALDPNRRSTASQAPPPAGNTGSDKP
jgi:serine/threonine-protein kinase